jgi:hypothetical protein
MRNLAMLAAGLAMLVGLWAIGSTGAKAQVYSNNPDIALMDNCDVNNFPPGICVAVPHRSDVGIAEFLSLLYSPNYKNVVGHPAWRMDPSYLDIRDGQTLVITNKGAENHTFTEVANFGGGVVPGLNGAPDAADGFPAPPTGTVALPITPECAALPGSAFLSPGQSTTVTPSHGNHKFQCCVHPWMRIAIGAGT